MGFSCSPGPDGRLLSGPVAPFLKETIEVPMRVGSSSSLSGLRTVDFFPVFPRVFAPGLSWLPLTGFDFAGLVDWLTLAPRSRNPHSQSGHFSLLCDLELLPRRDSSLQRTWKGKPASLESLFISSTTFALRGVFLIAGLRKTQENIYRHLLNKVQ